MKMRLLVVLLACVSGMAVAEWTQVGTSNSGKDCYFLDLETRQKAPDGKVKLAYLYDLKTPDQSGAKPALSVVGENEFDCKARQYRSMAMSKHAGNMGAGDVVFTSSGPGEWSQIPPRSRTGRMFKLACSKPDRVVAKSPPASCIHQSGTLRRAR
jgi:hypothetical protein